MRLTTSLISQAETKSDINDPVIPSGRVIAQQIKGPPGITGLSPPSVHSDGEVWHLDVGSSHPGAVVGPKDFELGAVDFISKPISPPIVEARVKAHLNFKITNDKIRDLPKQLGRYLSPQIVQAIIDGKSEAKINTKRKNSQFSFQILLALHLQVNLWNLRIKLSV